MENSFSSRRWTNQILGGNQDLTTSILVRQRPIQGEGHVYFLGESEGSLPPPHDSFPDAGEAKKDFWSMSGNFIYRHHVETRLKLYSPREESFSITHTNTHGETRDKTNEIKSKLACIL